MNRVYKYKLLTADGRPDTFKAEMPEGSILFVEIENEPPLPLGRITLWSRVDLMDDPDYVRTFRVFGTGHDIPANYAHVHTWRDSQFIWHLFEEG